MAIFPIGAKVGADTSSFISAMGGATRGLSAFAGAGGLATAGVGALAVGIGIAVSAAREFQTEMIKLNTLVGIQIEQVEAWEKSIKDLATETGQAPVDLAKAMFAITSGGARGSEALEILEAAAKASAIGLGDMTAIGRTATAMLQAFGNRGLTAEKAIDVLTSTVREGNLEASSLAGAFSRVLGPAAALGSSVEDIGGFMATFTRLGGSTEQAATGLLNVFNLLIKPPSDAREAMEELGISIEEVRATIREKGLLAGLALMQEELEGNVDALGRVIPNTRALIGFLNTIGLQADQYAISQGNVNDSLGTTAEAFETWSDTADAAFKRFGAEAKVAAITVGEIFLPPLVLLLKALTELTGILTFSAEGWKLFFELLGDGVEFAFGPVKEFLDLVASAPVVVDEAAEKMNTFRERLEDLNDVGLESLEDFLQAAIRDLEALIAAEDTSTAARAAANDQLDRERTKLADVRAALAQETEARRLLDEELEKQRLAREALLVPNEDELESIQQIIDALEDEIDTMTLTREAIIDKELVDLKASDTTREAVRLLLEEVAALEALAEATKEAEREKDKAAREEERRLKSLKRERERKAEQEQRKQEREELARLNAEMAEAMRIATEFAETIGDAFFEVIQGTKSVGEAFGDMVTDILKQLARLAIQRAIVEPLLGAILGEFGPSVPGGNGSFSPGNSATSIIPGGTSVTRASHRPGHFDVTTGGGGGGATIIQQTINFAPSLIDGKSGQKFIEEQAGVITGLVAEGAQRSAQLANAFQGQTG